MSHDQTMRDLEVATELLALKDDAVIKIEPQPTPAPPPSPSPLPTRPITASVDAARRFLDDPVWRPEEFRAWIIVNNEAARVECDYPPTRTKAALRRRYIFDYLDAATEQGNPTRIMERKAAILLLEDSDARETAKTQPKDNEKEKQEYEERRRKEREEKKDEKEKRWSALSEGFNGFELDERWFPKSDPREGRGPTENMLKYLNEQTEF